MVADITGSGIYGLMQVVRRSGWVVFDDVADERLDLYASPSRAPLSDAFGGGGLGVHSQVMDSELNHVLEGGT